MKYQDLSDEAKEVALDEHKNNAADYSWDDDTKQYWVEKLEAKGIFVDENDIQWTGFWSQGDGLSFTGDIALRTFMEEHSMIRENHKELYLSSVPFNGEALADWYIRLTRMSHNYSHAHTVQIEVSDLICSAHDEDGMWELWAQAENEILNQCRDYMGEMYCELEKEYEYIISEKALIEAEGEYTADGRLE
jgi:hypothetical protein